MKKTIVLVLALLAEVSSLAFAQGDAGQVASLPEMIAKAVVENSDMVAKDVATVAGGAISQETDGSSTLERRAHLASQIALVIGGTLDGVTTFRGLTPYTVSYDKCWADGGCSHTTSTSVWREGGFGFRNLINPQSRGQAITALVVADSLAIGLSELAYRKGGAKLRVVAIVANIFFATTHTKAAIQNQMVLSAYRQAQVPAGAFNISW